MNDLTVELINSPQEVQEIVGILLRLARSGEKHLGMRALDITLKGLLLTKKFLDVFGECL